MTSIKQILDIKLINNDINIVDKIMDYKYQMERADHSIKFNPVLSQLKDTIYTFEDKEFSLGRGMNYWGNIRCNHNGKNLHWCRDSYYDNFPDNEHPWDCEVRFECNDCGEFYNQYMITETMDEVDMDRYHCYECDNWYCGCKGYDYLTEENPCFMDKCDGYKENHNDSDSD